MLRGCADEHVSQAIVLALRARGMDITAVAESHLVGSPDDLLLDQALAEERVMLTCDSDFLRLANERWGSGANFAPIFFWPQQQRTVGRVVREIIQLAATHTYSQASSRVFFL